LSWVELCCGSCGSK